MIFKWLLKISRDGDSTTSLDKVCQSSFTCIVQKCFLMFRGSLLGSSLCPLFLILALGTTEKSLSLSCTHPLGSYIHWSGLPHTGQSQLSYPFLKGEMLQSLHHLCVPLLDCLQYYYISLVLRSPVLDTVLQMWPQQGWVEPFLYKLVFSPYKSYNYIQDALTMVLA